MLATMFSWASTNLPPEEITALNASLDAGGALAVQAVRALSATYHATEGTVPQLLTGGPLRPGEGVDVYPAGPDGYRMMVNDMKDPRYKDPNDPTFRNQVEAKIERSKL